MAPFLYTLYTLESIILPLLFISSSFFRGGGLKKRELRQGKGIALLFSL